VITATVYSGRREAGLVMTSLRLAVLRGSLSQEEEGKEKDYEGQNDGSGGIGWGVCCGHGGGDGVGWGDGCGAGEDAGSGGAGTASYPAEGLQPTVTDEDIALLRQDIRAKKMQVIGQNMSLSDTEAQKFWPIYKHYADDLHEVNNSKYALLKQYAETWATMTDQDALIYVRHWMEVDAEAQALRLKYVPAVTQALPGKKAATFFQLDRRLSMIVDLQLFSQIPLAHVKESSSIGPQ
jgi:hypothetical protein